MKKPVLAAISLGLIVLAALIFMFTRNSLSPAAYSSSLSSETPPPRAGSPTFAPSSPPVIGGRGAPGRSTAIAPPPK